MNWEDFIDRGEQAIADLIGTQESLTLEFKADHPKDPLFRDGQLTDHGRRVIAKELSAFSNSAGGILVLGVDCRSVDHVDQAQKLVPIHNISRAETAIRSAVFELLQPRHDSIDVHVVRSADNPDSGFMAISVPRSERRPHRSEARGQKEYFRRSGSSAVAMEHYDIEDAFRRSTSPLLSLVVDHKWRMKSGDGKFMMLLELGLENEGEATAKSVSMQLWNILGLTYSRQTTIQHSKFSGKMLLAANSDFVVHPGDTRKFAELSFNLQRTREGQLLFNASPLSVGMLEFSYSIGAEGMRRRAGRYLVGERDLEIIDAVTSEGAS